MGWKKLILSDTKAGLIMRKKEGKINLFDTVPIRASQVLTEWEGEYVVLAFPRFKQKWMQRWLLPKGMPSYMRVQLEEHGTAVWMLIDGKRTVSEIISLLASHFKGEAGYESRVTTYLMRMQKDGFVRLLSSLK